MSIEQWFTAYKDLIVGIASFLTIFIAFIGLRTWRKQLLHKSQFELAKRVLKAVYKVRDAFIHVRNPVIFVYEYPAEMLDEMGVLSASFAYEGNKNVYAERWKVMIEAFSELEDIFLEAQVEWGPQYQDKIVPLRKCRGELKIAISDFLEMKNPDSRRKFSDAETQNIDSTIYYGGENVTYDKFTPKFTAVRFNHETASKR